MSDPADLIWIDTLDNNMFWTEKVTGMRWGPEMNDPVEYAFDEINGLTATGAGCILGP